MVVGLPCRKLHCVVGSKLLTLCTFFNGIAVKYIILRLSLTPKIGDVMCWHRFLLVKILGELSPTSVYSLRAIIVGGDLSSYGGNWRIGMETMVFRDNLSAVFDPNDILKEMLHAAHTRY